MMYYEIVESPEQLVGAEGFLRLPSYIFDEFVFDINRQEALRSALEYLKRGENVLIVGKAGTGKTAFLAIVLKKLMDMGYHVAKIVNGEIIKRDHEAAGIYIFYDDLPRMEKRSLISIVENKPRMIIATARLEALDELTSKLGERPESFFKVIIIQEMDESHLREILLRFARREGIEVLPEAADIVTKKADRLPVYIWQVIRDLVISRSNILDVEFARRIPQGMLEYVDRILWNVVGEAEDRLEVLLTLITMTHMPEYEMHQDLFNAVFIEATKEIKGIENPSQVILLRSKTLNKIRRYLARTPRYSFRLPHDSWADVLRGQSTGLLSGEIADLLYTFPETKRIELLRRAAERAYRESVSKSKDPARIREFVRQINLLGFKDILISSPKAELVKTTQQESIPMEKPLPPPKPKVEEVPAPIVERKEYVSVRLYAVAKKLLYPPGRSYSMLKISDVTQAILGSLSYQSFCGVKKNEAFSKIMFRKIGNRIVLRYPCWGDVSITETIDIVSESPPPEKVFVGIILLFLGIILMAIPIIGWILGLLLIIHTATNILSGMRVYLVQLELNGSRDALEGIIREARQRLGRRPLLVSPQTARIIRKKLGTDPMILEREWYAF